MGYNKFRQNQSILHENKTIMSGYLTNDNHMILVVHLLSDNISDIICKKKR